MKKIIKDEEKEPMTTKEAFKELINTRGIYKLLNIDESTCRYYRKRFNDGEYISIEKIEELLKKAGYRVVQEKLWEC